MGRRAPEKRIRQSKPLYTAPKSVYHEQRIPKIQPPFRRVIA